MKRQLETLLAIRLCVLNVSSLKQQVEMAGKISG